MHDLYEYHSWTFTASNAGFGIAAYWAQRYRTTSHWNGDPVFWCAFGCLIFSTMYHSSACVLPKADWLRIFLNHLDWGMSFITSALAYVMTIWVIHGRALKLLCGGAVTLTLALFFWSIQTEERYWSWHDSFHLFAALDMMLVSYAIERSAKKSDIQSGFIRIRIVDALSPYAFRFLDFVTSLVKAGDWDIRDILRNIRRLGKK